MEITHDNYNPPGMVTATTLALDESPDILISGRCHRKGVVFLIVSQGCGPFRVVFALLVVYT